MQPWFAQVQNKPASASPNPVALSEAQALAKELKAQLGEPPSWLTKKIRAPGVHFAAIGGETSLFRLASELLDSRKISQLSLLEAIENLCGKSDVKLRLMEDVPAAMKHPQSVHTSTLSFLLPSPLFFLLCCTFVLFARLHDPFVCTCPCGVKARGLVDPSQKLKY